VRVAILQSSYLPWKGYFDIIHSVDAFVFYDDVQYTPRDWRSRNRFKLHGGPAWLTVPAGSHRSRLICEVVLADDDWQRNHWNVIKHNYGKCPYFPQYETFFARLFCGTQWTSLSELNQHAIRGIATELLGIETQFHDSREFHAEGAKTDRLLSVLKGFSPEVSHYVSGPSARGYIEEEKFRAAGIEVEFMDYSGYPEYPQRFPPFRHDVSVLDLLFNVGEQAPHYIWGWRGEDRS
jgi:hypothetical protein